MIALRADWVLAAAAIAVGTCAGSFVGAVVARLPRGETVLWGRSRCDACAAVLRPLELVPILSYLASRGRCRRCGATIDIDAIVAEIAGAAVALLAVGCATTIGGGVAIALFGWALVTLALLDHRHFWLPDALTIPLLIGGLAATPLLPAIGLSSRLLGAALAYLGIEALRRGYRRARGRAGIGAGDAKLLAAIGSWLGAPAVPSVVLIGAGIGLALAGAKYLRGGELSRDTRLPFGAFLSVGALLWLPVALTRPDATLLDLVRAWTA